MLILTRKVGDKIRIGNDIEISVQDIKGRQVRIGIKAPRKLSVLRDEVFTRIREENIKAARSPVDIGTLARLNMNGGKKP